MGAFLVRAHRIGIRTRQGAELRKRASVFQRSTRGAMRRSERRRRQPHATSLIAHHMIWKRSSQGDRFCLGPTQRDSNPTECVPFQRRCESIAKTGSGSPNRATYGASATRNPFRTAIFARARPKRPTGSRLGCPRRLPRTRAAAKSAACGLRSR